MTRWSDGRPVGFHPSVGRHYEDGPIALALVKRNTALDAVLTTGSLTAAQTEVVACFRSGLSRYGDPVSWFTLAGFAICNSSKHTGVMSKLTPISVHWAATCASSARPPSSRCGSSRRSPASATHWCCSGA